MREETLEREDKMEREDRREKEQKQRATFESIHCVQLFHRQLWAMIGNDVESQTRVVENLLCTCHCRGRRRTLPLLLRPCLQERTDRERQLSTRF